MSYVLQSPDIVWSLLLEHVVMTAMALSISVAIALPIGILVARHRSIATLTLGVLSILYTIPSIALMILLLPIFGLSPRTVIVALVIYAQVILVRNIVTGIHAIDPAVLEAARGMGMNAWQCWWRVQLPLALPVILAGVRVAGIAVIGIATIGAKFGAGGLGRLLFDGIAQTGRYDKIWAGAIAVGLLAFVLNGLLLWPERQFDPLRRIRRAPIHARTTIRTDAS